jgi:diaminohydroxyphosphoribosylaminopyrimidine deaminase/5-amino-6-(5-phosphoribosylamino)uracil reductase
MKHEIYMQRCFQLAKLAGSEVGTNPNVGALLVHDEKIIGEGYHEKFGAPHAEVNAIASVSDSNKHLIPDSTLYVSLEPCNIHRKTPPCSQLILRHKIKTLVVGCQDPNPEIAGSSLSFLERNGVQIIKNICRQEAEELIAPFTVNILENRPFITIKFAQSKDFFISQEGYQTWLSSESSKIFSHQLRSLNHGILIGNRTAIIDNPSLTNRLYSGSSPLRICIDPKNKIPFDSVLFQDEFPTLIINESERKEKLKSNKEQWTMSISLNDLVTKLYTNKGVGRLIVEGGSKTIESFLKEELWDMAHVINTNRLLHKGVKSPTINGRLSGKMSLENDTVFTIRK